MAVDDHGLEAMRKAALDISGNGTNYALQILGSFSAVESPFAAPPLTKKILRSVSGGVETYDYKDAGSVLLKTVVVTYTDSTLKELVSVEVTYVL